MYQIVNDTSVKHLPSGAVFPVPAVESFGFAYQAWLDAGNTPEPAPIDPPPTPERVQAEITARTQQRLDEFAQTRNYDGILSACTYATSTVAKFQSEGQYCVNARDATWARLYELLAEVHEGTRPMPSGYSDIEPELPALTWPGATL